MLAPRFPLDKWHLSIPQGSIRRSASVARPLAVADNRRIAGARAAMRRGARDVGDPAVLRVFTFRSSGSSSEVDETLRATLIPDLVALPGLVDVLVGRRSDDLTERVVASVWDGSADRSIILDERPVIVQLHPEEEERMADLRVDVATLRLAIRRERSEPPRILRLFRGEVRTGEMGEYIERAHEGTNAEAERDGGPVALYLGTTAPSTFVTVSAWTDWESIEDATGGNIHQPMATKHAELLASVDVRHFELLPNADRPGARSEAPQSLTIR
jgi:hypothetical protein